VPILIVPLAACSVSGFINVLKIAGAVIELVTVVLESPPASDLATFNASQAAEDLQLSNTSLASTTGNVTITISDQNNGTLLGQGTFGYTINGSDVLTFNNPSEVTNWVRSFSTYNGYVNVQYKTAVNVAKPASGTAKLTATWLYQSAPYSTASATFTGSGGGCPTHNCKIK